MTKNSDLIREIEELKTTFRNLCRNYSELQMERVELQIEHMELTIENENLRKTAAKLKNTIAYYDNSNSPPSRNTLTQIAAAEHDRARNKDKDKKTVTKSAGGQKGHKGCTDFSL